MSGLVVERRPLIAALSLVAALLAGLVAAAQAAKDDLVLVSRASGADGRPGNAQSFDPSISLDGRFVAFGSSASNLSADGNDTEQDVFVRDLMMHTTMLVSRASGATGAAGDAASSSPSVSSDGRFVAFTSRASNLSGEDADSVGSTVVSDVFVRDLLTGLTTYVSRASGAAGEAGAQDSFNPSIAADGRFVAFDSDAANLSDEDTDDGNNTPIRDVFVRDVQTNTTTLVSRVSGASGTAGDQSSFGAAISAGGRFVAFESPADNLSVEDDDSVTNVFVRDLETKTTTYVSRASGAGGVAGDGDAGRPSISADGRFVAFGSDADNLSAEDNNAIFNVFVRDLATNTTTYVSRASGAAGAAGDDHSFSPSISADGRFVSFTSEADSPSGADNDAIDNIFVRDLQANTTTYVNRATGAAGAAADGESEFSAISRDGRFVAFDSTADSLSGEDTDAVTDIFVRDVLGPPPLPPGPPPLPPGPAPPSPGAAGTAGPAIAGALSRANGAIQVSRSGRFRLFCGRYSEPVSGRCGGRSVRPVGAAQRRRGRILRLGMRSFTAAPGGRALVRFRLARANLKRLKTARRIRMRGTVVARDALGNATTARFRFTLAEPKPKRRRAGGAG